LPTYEEIRWLELIEALAQGETSGEPSGTAVFFVGSGLETLASISPSSIGK
jgi:hypothetical protein